MNTKKYTFTSFLLKYVFSQKYYYLCGIFAIALTNWIAVNIPLYFKQAFDVIKSEGHFDRTRITTILLTTVGLSFLIVIVRTFSRVMYFNPARKIEMQIKSDIFERSNKISADYLTKTSTGSIISRLNNDISYTRALFGFGALQIINILFMFSLAPLQMIAISPMLTLYSIGPLVFGFILLRIGIRFITGYTKKRTQSLQELSNFSLSALNGIDVVNNYKVEDWVKQKFASNNEDIQSHSTSLLRWGVFSFSLLDTIEDLVKIIIFSFAAITISSQNFSIGDIVAFLTYTALLTPPLASLGWLTYLLRQGAVSVNNLLDIYNQPLREDIEKSVVPLAELESEFYKSGITVNGLSFTYPGISSPAINDISFSIKPGQTVGILGKVGSGKSTLVDCLTKMQTISAGMIKIGKYDSTAVLEKDWRSLILGLPQNPFLFSDTVKNNILLKGNSDDLSPSELGKILDMSSLSDEVKQFRDKELELVGEKGITLSGGQKQRISIARSFLGSYCVLMLDNVLSALDYKTEDYIIEQIFKNKTASSLIIVSHRTSPLKRADLILVLEDGKLIEQGTHEELLELDKNYATIFKMQKNE